MKGNTGICAHEGNWFLESGAVAGRQKAVTWAARHFCIACFDVTPRTCAQVPLTLVWQDREPCGRCHDLKLPLTVRQSSYLSRLSLVNKYSTRQVRHTSLTEQCRHEAGVPRNATVDILTVGSWWMERAAAAARPGAGTDELIFRLTCTVDPLPGRVAAPNYEVMATWQGCNMRSVLLCVSQGVPCFYEEQPKAGLFRQAFSIDQRRSHLVTIDIALR